MERRAASSYLSMSPRLSFGKFSSSSSITKDYTRRKKSSKFPKRPVSLRPSPKQSLPPPRSAPFNLSHHNKHTPKMLAAKSLKRPHPGGEGWRPFKKQVVEVTGLEEDSIVSEVSPKILVSTISASEIDIYSRRRKVANYASTIRRKRALANKVSGDWIGKPASAQRGMVNFTAALCYRLSLLQSLLHQPKFAHWLQEYHRPEDCVSDDKEDCVACCVRLLTLEYWRGAQDPQGLSKVLRGMDKLFTFLGWRPDTRSGHADPDEQLAWLSGALQKALPASVFFRLQSVLHLGTTSVIRCRQCGYESRTTGHDDGVLSVPIAPKIPNGTLTMYLQKYMVEVIEGYRCEKCNDEGKKHRKQLIGHASDVLAVLLKRTDAWGNKVNTPVIIEPTLNLDNYRDTNNHDQLRYELTAVIKHSGSAGFGHYICSAKGPDGNWLLFDDQKKSSTSVGEATSSARQGFTPYLLFFQRLGK